MNLSAISKLSEDEARDYYEKIRWPNGPACPHCGSDKFIKIGRGKRPGRQSRQHRDGLYKCHAEGCEKQFTSTVGTILEDTHLPFRTWLMAFAIMCSSKKGVSALQLQRQLGLGSYRSAWHLAHHIRHAMAKEPMAGLLSGTVEVDETFIDCKPRHGAPRTPRAAKRKVMALVERGGRVRAHQIDRLDGNTLKAAIRKNVDRSSQVMTDEWAAYQGIGKEFKGGHHVVNHKSKEYKRGDASTNEVEAFFALLKRGITGSFHHVSKQHLDRYCAEFSFRWNHRKITDSERTVEAIRSSEGQRLLYGAPIRKH
jgi:transposase-like protein